MNVARSTFVRMLCLVWGAWFLVVTLTSIADALARVWALSGFPMVSGDYALIERTTAVYNVPPPKSDAERQACVGKVNDFCSTSPCTSSWSGLVGADAPSIPPNSSIVVYTAAYFAADTGGFILHARTKSLL